MVDYFGVKYKNKDDGNHLVASIKTTYTLTKDWSGDLYDRIVLALDYINRTVDISMSGYIKKKIQEYKQVQSKCTQTCPYLPAPKQFGTEAQAPLPPNVSPHLTNEGIHRVQRIMGSILYYACAVDMTVLMALSMVVSEQTAATEKTLGRCTQLLDYLASNSDAKVQYYASDMVMNIHLYASYLSESKAGSYTCGHFFMGWIPKSGEPIKLKGAFDVDLLILRFVVASTAKVELGALFHNCQTGIIF